MRFLKVTLIRTEMPKILLTRLSRYSRKIMRGSRPCFRPLESDYRLRFTRISFAKNEFWTRSTSSTSASRLSCW